jgi:chemotaxis protein MotB
LSEDQHPEIVIVKRHARHADEHHGGAWKIAFADFMTAMMALFLVLWLISSTSDKQRRAVAQYFNPVKLVDMTTLKKGFHDPKDTEMGSGNMPDAKTSEQPASQPRQKTGEPAADSLESGKHAGGKPPAEIRDGGAEAVRNGRTSKASDKVAQRARSGRDNEPIPAARAFAYADPFARAADEPEPADDFEPLDVGLRQSDSSPNETMPTARIAQPEGLRQALQRTARSEADDFSKRSPAAPGSQGQADLEMLASEIQANAASNSNPHAAPRVEVGITDEGLLISLTDAIDDTMFSIGSADPHRKTIEALQKIAHSLAQRPGAIIIRGHTDARPYRSGTSDNWRLSTSRAHAARDVLIRSGLAQTRIERIEGYADRNPRVPTDPNAPENRRIEILLRKGRG